MKQFVFTVIVLLFVTISWGQGIEFFDGSWEEALEEGRKQDKIIFVDAYAVWCGPCKKMAKNVFPNEKVGAFYNKNFINMKLDMEKGEGLKFRQKYPVSAFPTLLYIDYDGKVIQQVKGAQQADGFIRLGKIALQQIDRSGQFAELYEKGDRDPELVFNYVRALNKAGKPSLQIANEYLHNQDDLSTEHNLRFILEAAVEADSRIFDLLVQYQDQIAQLEPEEKILEKIEQACGNTLNKAIEYQSENLFEEAKSKMKKHNPEKADKFVLKADMDFCETVGDTKAYLKACKNYANKVIKDNAEGLHALAISIDKSFPDDTKAMSVAEKYAKEATELVDQYLYYYTYASILYKNKKKPEALKIANRSLELAKKEKSNRMAVFSIEKLIQLIEG